MGFRLATKKKAPVKTGAFFNFPTTQQRTLIRRRLPSDRA
jgi:hypothetical protein